MCSIIHGINNDSFVKFAVRVAIYAEDTVVDT